jgi:hypothetical protein
MISVLFKAFLKAKTTFPDWFLNLHIFVRLRAIPFHVKDDSLVVANQQDDIVIRYEYRRGGTIVSSLI